MGNSMAKSSTSFKNGHQISKGKGRKGYEYEEAQLKEMRAILNRALITTKRMQLDEAQHKEMMAYENSLRMVLKIMDKLHANKSEMDITSGGQTFLPSPEEQLKIDACFAKRIKKI